MSPPLADNTDSRVSVLAPPSWAKFLSYLTGWMNVISWQAALASTAFLAGTMIQGLIVLNYESYEFQRWHGTLLLFALIAVALFTNTFLARFLPTIESILLVLHILGFFAIVIVLVQLAPHKSAREVFATFGSSGWSPDGLAFFIGLTTSMFAFIGRRP
jgi:amino acid transporter